MQKQKWETRTAEIRGSDGRVVFRAENIEVPSTWSFNATDIVAEKYFRFVEQADGSLQRETSVRQMIDRVVGTLASWGVTFSHLRSDNAKKFYDDLTVLILDQKASFNSPVWFNVGTKRGRIGEEQASACFINSVDDDMESILELSEIEGRLYKAGSGSGVNYSKLRSSKERLSGGGLASGPVSFMAKDDANAGAIKSGGTTRRAAKMAILNVDHPDILEFITCKAKSERAAQALVTAGFDGDFRSRWGAYQMVPFQNANHSVRVTDEFMRAVENNESWNLLARDGKTVIETVPARKIWDAICEAAHFCGDPGLQFDTTINDWHTSSGGGRINASNPCGEFMYLDNTACNLASLNLLKFWDGEQFDIDSYRNAIDVMITAMEIIVGGAAYPTETIARNSHAYRPLGLGYTNLGALLIARGLAYDSDEARSFASAVTSLLTARAYRRSGEMAASLGPFPKFPETRDAMLRVIQKHASANEAIAVSDSVTHGLQEAATADWTEALRLGSVFGYRNGQVSVIAPTGTISFMMDADTTGIECELSLVKQKKLVGGGTMKIVNRQVPAALRKLGYGEDEIASVEKYVLEHGSVVGSAVRPEHYAVFDSSFPDPVGDRSLRPEAHVAMMAAVQPFVSGAISKTCNIPANATKEDVSRLYLLAWRSGLKAIALYRDGSKYTQPLQSAFSKVAQAENATTKVQREVVTSARRKLPRDCAGARHKFKIGEHEGYIHVGLYDDGTPGEVFIKMSKEGSTISGLMDAIGILFSMGLQYGVPLEVLVEKFSHTSFEPSGWTDTLGTPGRATSIMDYLVRWLDLKYGDKAKARQPIVVEDGDLSSQQVEQKALVAPVIITHAVARATANGNGAVTSTSYQVVYTGNLCPRCGFGTQRTGSCRTCGTCGWNEGCG